MCRLDEDILDALRISHSPQKRVRLILMKDPYQPVPPGTEGTVKSVDGMGTVQVRWDTGSKLGLIYGEDEWIVIP